MIVVKITTNDYKLVKDGPYIKELSSSFSWFYKTENKFVLVEKLYRAAYLYIAKDQKEYEKMIKELKESKP